MESEFPSVKLFTYVMSPFAAKVHCFLLYSLARARYHPPQLLLYRGGTRLLQNSNNSSGSTDTVNPATGLTADVDFGEEYITNLGFIPSEITLAVPESGTGLLLAAGLVARRRSGRAG